MWLSRNGKEDWIKIMIKTISERISYLPASENPLSAEVVFVHGDEYEWIFDVGNCDEAYESIQSIKRRKNVVISHFHADHMGNISRIRYDNLYGGRYTCKKCGDGTVVSSTIEIVDGCKITIFPIICSHAKGSVGMMINDETAFIGDATCGIVKNGVYMHNPDQLRELIKTLEKIPADKIFLSHRMKEAQNKEDVIKQLQAVQKTGTDKFI